ncbi:hypothetical protein DFH08DRAFT_115867 [Mycena albidolilacea]|uniref:Uncharacterized protein n=1 Tax=Mycena albidolilacea TaxID=1033008 RepID=A0AAD7A6T2_9AGAR|nr:hypothetical protein DFH08DRAFT_115867 [Mycena albidolilacea]
MLCWSAVAPGLNVLFLLSPGFRPLYRRFAPAVFWLADWGISLPKAGMMSLAAVPVNVALTVPLLYGHAKTSWAVSRTALFAGVTLGSLLTAYLAVSVVQMGWRLFRQHAASRR